jgi:hypothetical protein
MPGNLPKLAKYIQKQESKQIYSGHSMKGYLMIFRWF